MLISKIYAALKINKNYQDLSEKGANKIHKIDSCLLANSCPALLRPHEL